LIIKFDLSKLKYLIENYNSTVKKYQNNILELKKKIEEIMVAGSGYFESEPVNFDWDTNIKITQTIDSLEKNL